MLALTLWPEWTWMIAYLPEPLAKRVENRSWKRPGQLPPGTRFAIHAGTKNCAAHDWHARLCNAEDMARREEQRLWGYPTHVRCDSESLFYRGQPLRSPTGAITSIVTLAGYDREMLTGWDVPEVEHWRLADVFNLPDPVPCRGAQGLWTIPPDVMEKAEAQMREFGHA